MCGEPHCQGVFCFPLSFKVVANPFWVASLFSVAVICRLIQPLQCYHLSIHILKLLNWPTFRYVCTTDCLTEPSLTTGLCWTVLLENQHLICDCIQWLQRSSVYSGSGRSLSCQNTITHQARDPCINISCADTGICEFFLSTHWKRDMQIHSVLWSLCCVLRVVKNLFHRIKL